MLKKTLCTACFFQNVEWNVHGGHRDWPDESVFAMMDYMLYLSCLVHGECQMHDGLFQQPRKAQGSVL